MKLIERIKEIFLKKTNDEDDELKVLRERSDKLVEEYYEKSELSMKDLTEFGGKL